MSDPWSSFALSTDGLLARYCELNHLGDLLRQPSNALSSLSYVGVGILVYRQQRRALVQPALSVVLALSLVCLGLCSHFFHASIILVAQELDMAATYAVVLALIAMGVGLCWPKIDGRFLVLTLVACDALFYALDFYLYGPWLLPLLLGVALVMACAVAMRRSGSRASSTLSPAVLALVIGGASWALDDQKVGCNPHSIFQWHALWHIATAAGAYWLFRFFSTPGAVQPRVSTMERAA